MMARANIQRAIAHLASQCADARRASQRASRGFTMVETMMALLIVVLLTGIVATSIPVAINASRAVADDSNAQLALSTTASALRDELGLAVDVKTDTKGTAFYQTSDGNWVTIDNGGDTSIGLVKHIYPDVSGGFNPNSVATYTEIASVDLVPRTAIAGSEGGQKLRVKMVGNQGASPFITYDSTSGVFTVHGVEVLIGGTSTEKIDDYKVKKIFDFA